MFTKALRTLCTSVGGPAVFQQGYPLVRWMKLAHSLGQKVSLVLSAIAGTASTADGALGLDKH
jgi:hypothetical protein